MLMAFNNPGVAVLSQCASLVRPAVGLPPRACSPGRYSQRGKWDDTKKTCSKGSMQNPLNEERGVLSENHIRTYWWCSPARIGMATIAPER